jgi:hypothetical protein
MSNNTSKSKAAALAAVQALIAGTEKDFPNAQLTFGGNSFTTAALVALFTSLIDAIKAVNLAQASARDAVAELVSVEAKVGPIMRAFVRFVRAAFPATAIQLADFGLQPPKARTPLTVEQKAAAKAKSLATRKARGTTGPKKKLAVTGGVTGVIVTPVMGAAPAAPEASPAASPATQPASIASNAASPPGPVSPTK